MGMFSEWAEEEIWDLKQEIIKLRLAIGSAQKTMDRDPSWGDNDDESEAACLGISVELLVQCMKEWEDHENEQCKNS